MTHYFTDYADDYSLLPYDYVTVEKVTEILGANWWGTSDADRCVMLANAWLNERIFPIPEYIGVQIERAGAEIAKEAAAGTMYPARTTGVLSKSVSAGSVSSSKTFNASSKVLTQGEVVAMALIAPWAASNRASVVRG